jgi:tetratricopeptide (TPR) repeat protein
MEKLFGATRPSSENQGRFNDPVPRPQASPPPPRQTLAVCLSLAALVWAVFGQTLHFDFVSYDDPSYLYQNPVITQGLTLSGIGWLFTHSNVGTWFPVTDVSHQLDWQLYGANAGGHHLTNVLLHTAATICLFLVLNRLTRRFWPAAVVAASFAVHPLRVESVAWVVERKDVLSGLFFMLTLWAWTCHVEKISPPPGSADVARPGRRFTSGYWLALLFFALGLMSKSMLVTLPAILLLLDFWPLNRLTLRSPLPIWLGLIVEKTPFLLLSIATAIVTLRTQTGAMTIAHASTRFARASNALLAYADYLGHMLYPVGLTVVYAPPPASPVLWQVGLATLLMLAVTAAALLWHRQHPWLLVGWLWYLGMLLPVIDIMQAARNVHADRYTYLPQIGFCIIIVWGALALSASWRHRQVLRIAGAITLILALAVGAFIQTGYWKNSLSLWTRALACKSDQAFIHNTLGSFLLNSGDVRAAVQHFEKSLQLDADNPDAHVNLGIALVVQENRPAAIQQFEQALQLNPFSSDAHYNLGVALAAQGQTAEAIQHLRRALELNPNHAGAHYALGVALAGQDDWDEAIPQYDQALHLKVDRTDAQYITAVALATDQKWSAAIVLYRQVLAARPDFAEAHNNLGIALTSLGKSDEAKLEFQQALTLAKTQGNAALAESISTRLKSIPSHAISKPAP